MALGSLDQKGKAIDPHHRGESFPNISSDSTKPSVLGILLLPGIRHALYDLVLPYSGRRIWHVLSILRQQLYVYILRLVDGQVTEYQGSHGFQSWTNVSSSRVRASTSTELTG